VDLAGRVEGAPSSRLLLAALSDENAAVRAEAALALGEGGYREALRQLLDRKGSDTSADVRRAAATALRRLAPQ
jgi:HEAT repeat protein